MGGSRTLIIVGIVIVAMAVAVGGYVLYRNMRQAEPAETPVPEGGGPDAQPETVGMQEIVVAAQNIPRGTRITAENNAVKLARWPQESVPSGALTDLEAAYERLARLDIPLDVPITEAMLAEKGAELSMIGSDVALQIPSGRVGYALPVARWSSVAWAVQPGDHVDVLISLLIVDLDEEFQTELPNQAACMSMGGEGEEETCQDGILGRIEILPTGQVVNLIPNNEKQRPRMVAQLTVQDAIVVGVGDWREEPLPPAPEEGETAEGEEGPPPPPPPPEVDSLTLAVTPQDALVLKYAEELGASMDMVLRSSDDAGNTVITEQVTLDYIFQRFSMEVPPKLPYGASPPARTLRRGTTGEVPEETGGEIRTEESTE
jgi:pilus assembly protein CpaB